MRKLTAITFIALFTAFLAVSGLAMAQEGGDSEAIQSSCVNHVTCIQYPYQEGGDSE